MACSCRLENGKQEHSLLLLLLSPLDDNNKCLVVLPSRLSVCLFVSHKRAFCLCGGREGIRSNTIKTQWMLRTESILAAITIWIWIWNLQTSCLAGCKSTTGCGQAQSESKDASDIVRDSEMAMMNERKRSVSVSTSLDQSQLKRTCCNNQVGASSEENQ